jgi:penicillin-binding protein 2
LELDENTPLVHRAAYGTYPPGSIFKPLVAMAALESGRLTVEQTFDCPGFLSLGNARFRCWNVYGHGRVNLHEAIQHSCNVYFYHAGLQSGPDAILSMAQAAGLGRKTGIPLDTESAGLLPSDGWKRQWQGDGWRDGDTCNLSIGQGFLLTTPLQMAVFASALANGGTVFRPRLIEEIIPPGQGAPRVFPVQMLNQIRWSEASIQAVRQAMEDVVASPQGTGRKAAVAGLRVAAKTGTAEWRKAENRKLAWMMAFAPADQPRVAMVVMLEDSISGGTSAAPVTRQVLEAIFQSPDKHRAEGDAGV